MLRAGTGAALSTILFTMEETGKVKSELTLF